MSRQLRHVAELLVVVGTAFALLALLLMATGHDVTRALGALVRGAFGSWYAISSATVVRAIPLGLAGLAVSLAFRAGILNIGAEGQLLMGAAAAAALAVPLATTTPWVAIPLLLIGGCAAGAAWAGIAAVLRARFGVLEVISTIMLNFVALYITGYLVRGPLQEPTRINPQSATLPDALQLPVLMDGTRLHAGVPLLVMVAMAVWWWLAHTASGFRVRAVGASVTAAHSAGGIRITRTVVLAFLASGVLAGLAGAVEYAGITFALYENFSPGYGYTAIGVALLARLHPLGVLATALLFGALEAGANSMQRDAGVPNVVVSVVVAMLILLVVAADLWSARRRAAGVGSAEVGA